MNLLTPSLVLMCLLVTGCAKAPRTGTAAVEQPAGPQTIRQQDPSQSTVPAPKPRKQIDPDTRGQGQVKAGPSSPGREA